MLEVNLRACPACGERRFQRIHRVGLWERWFLPIYGLYPWVCRGCGRKMLRFKEQPSSKPDTLADNEES